MELAGRNDKVDQCEKEVEEVIKQKQTANDTIIFMELFKYFSGKQKYNDVKRNSMKFQPK